MDQNSKYLIKSFPPDYKCESTVYDFDKQVVDYVDKMKTNNNSISGKCIIVGDVGVGKTCIINRFHKNVFTENYKLTIGVDFNIQGMYGYCRLDFIIKISNLNDFNLQDFQILGQAFKLNVWDTAGEERFKSITKTYYRNAHVALIVFDFSSIVTLSSIKRWANEILNNAVNKNPATGQLDEPLLFVVGTKKDLICESAFEYIEMEAMKIAKELKAQYFAVSSQTGENINQLFRNVAAFTFSEIILREIELNEHLIANSKIENKKVYANNFINNQSLSFKLKKNNKERFKGLNKLLKNKIKCFRF